MKTLAQLKSKLEASRVVFDAAREKLNSARATDKGVALALKEKDAARAQLDVDSLAVRQATFKRKELAESPEVVESKKIRDDYKQNKVQKNLEKIEVLFESEHTPENEKMILDAYAAQHQIDKFMSAHQYNYLYEVAIASGNKAPQFEEHQQLENERANEYKSAYLARFNDWKNAQ